MTNSGKKPRTVEEHLAEAEGDPAYRAMRERKYQLAQELGERIRVNEIPLIDELHAIGVKASSVWDLVNTGARYAVAIPVLLEHLQRDYIPEVREGIARALAVPEAAWAWDVLLELFTKEPVGGPRNVKFALALALSGAATDDVLDKMIALVQDPSLGETRLALLGALSRSKLPHARAVLEELRSDPQLSREIRIRLGSRKKQ